MRCVHPAIVPCFALLLALPACAQSSGTTPAADTNPAGGLQMLLPPPISGQAYPAGVGSQKQANYLEVGADVSSGYSRNLYPGVGSTSLNDVTTMIRPRIRLDHTGSRSHEALAYSPSFTYYRPNSSLDDTNQNAAAELQVQLSPYVSLQSNDTFQKTSNAFTGNLGSLGGTVYGSTPPVTSSVVAPFAPQWTNAANAGLSWQFGPNSMLGASGTLGTLRFTESPESVGLYNSDSRLVSGFYLRRVTSRKYLGAQYEYSNVQGTPVSTSERVTSTGLQANTVLGFYTFYPSRRLSLSLAGGYQAYTMTQPNVPSAQSWAPVGTASLGWQSFNTNFAVSYSRDVTAGEGVAGAFESNSARASAQWRISRPWTVAVAAGYSGINNVTPSQFFSSTSGGHTISGNISLDYAINRSLGLSYTYYRLHQTYADMPTITNNPNSDQMLVSLEYRLSKPLGR